MSLGRKNKDKQDSIWDALSSRNLMPRAYFYKKLNDLLEKKTLIARSRDSGRSTSSSRADDSYRPGSNFVC
jgi:hypothetical protein